MCDNITINRLEYSKGGVAIQFCIQDGHYKKIYIGEMDLESFAVAVTGLGCQPITRKFLKGE